MKILAIRFARLGDVILLLPALRTLKDGFPDSELTLLTGHRCAPIAELCPAIDHVISVDRLAMRDGPPWRSLRRMVALIRDIRRRHFDLVVDFHSFRETNLLTWLSGAPARIGMKRYKAPYLAFCFNRTPVDENKNLHVGDMFQKVAVSAVVPEAASLVQQPYGCENLLGTLTPERTANPTIVLFVDAPVPERVWPPERFAAVADFGVEKLGSAVTVISSGERADLATRVQQASRSRDRLTVLTGLSIPQLVAAIASAQLLISNDTGPMHIGPAVGVQTLALFSVGYPEHFRPRGRSDRFLQGNPIEEIKTEDVIKTVEEMWVTADRDLRR